MNFKNFTSLLFIATAFAFTSCQKENVNPPDAKGKLNIEFENVVNGEDLELNTKTYINANGDDFTISKFKYYISNIKLTKADGSVWTPPESYYLIDQAYPESSLIELKDIPVGEYKAISYTIGVDKDRNHAGAQTDALDPVNGMFWTWNSGYIFLKLEGTSSKSTGMNNSIMFHIGTDENIKEVSPDFNGQTFKISTGRTPEAHFSVDVAEIFVSPSTLNFATTNMIMDGSMAATVASNYVDMFKLEHIHN